MGNGALTMNIIQTFVQLQQTFVAEGQRFTCVERGNAEYTVQASGYTALAGDVTFANGLIGALQINGEVHVEIFGAVGDGITNDLVSFESARDRGLRSVSAYSSSGYFFSSTLNVNKSTFAIAGNPAMDTAILTNGEYTAIKFSPTDPLSTGFLNGQGLSNIVIAGNAQTVPALIISKAERFNGDAVRVTGYSKGILYEGGQTNSLSKLRILPPLVYAAGSYGIKFQAATTSGSDQEVYSCNIDDIFVSGSSSKRFEHCIEIDNSDGLNITNGYIAWGRTSNIKLEPLSANVIGLVLTAVYLDGVIKDSSGSDYGVYIPSTVGTGAISVGFNNCFIGQYAISAFFTDSTNVAEIKISDCEISNSVGLGLDVTGSSTSTNITITGGRVSGNTAGGIDITNANFINITNTNFLSNFGSGAINLSGNITSPKYGNLNFSNNTTNITDTSTKAGLKVVSDWYNEDDYTPVLSFGGGSVGITYSANTGYYHRVGSLVTATIEIVLTNKGSSTGTARVTLPFTSQGGSPNTPASVYPFELNVTNSVIGQVEDGSGNIVISQVSSGDASQLNDTHFNNGSVLRITASYRIPL
jgi:hypothetical protein